MPAIARLIESVEGRVTGHVFAAAPSQQAIEDYSTDTSFHGAALVPDRFVQAVIGLVADCADKPVSYG
ncbi:MAG: hypothetical protein AAGA08_05690 [Pseudomonadota bacterium]